MFTGIITDIGTVTDRTPLGDGARLTIASAYDPATIPIGASIACAGVCLTVTTLEPAGEGASFSVDVSAETLDKTTVGRWGRGTRINLERALKAGDELGGHLVSGHVDGTAEVVDRVDGAGGMATFTFAPPPALARFIASKGSVTLDATSLTSNAAGNTFSVAMIPHTLAVTTWGETRKGDRVNIEIDVIARYVERLFDPLTGARAS